MLEDKDPTVQSTALEYMKTMGDLAPAYLAFHDKWIQHGAIAAQRSDFISAFNGVSDALRERIARENEDLYDLIDRRNIAMAS